MNPAVLASSLSKSYRVPHHEPGLMGALKALVYPKYVEIEAVKNVSFQVDRGEIVGIVGPNGAGKSTLIKLLVGILQPDQGDLQVNGFRPFRDRRHYVRQIGVVFGQRTNLLWDLAVMESFELYRRIYGISRDDYQPRLQELTETFGLHELLSQPVRTLSLGQRVRATIALALLPRPRILFLDEPTIGMDIMAVDRLIGMLKDASRRQQITTLITSHDLGFIESLCQRLILFNQGIILFDGDVGEAVHKYSRYKKLKLVFPPPGVPQGVETLLPPSLKVQEVLHNQIACLLNEREVDYSDLLPLIQMLSRDYQLMDFFLEKPSLKEVILHVFR